MSNLIKALFICSDSGFRLTNNMEFTEEQFRILAEYFKKRRPDLQIVKETEYDDYRLPHSEIGEIIIDANTFHQKEMEKHAKIISKREQAERATLARLQKKYGPQ